jgi:class 3 adenylate cyclase/tetratricopeptide (TPR) repeat protein
MGSSPHDFELDRQWQAILVIDVVESVRLVQKPGARFPERWMRFVYEVRDACLPRWRGRLIKHTGDGMLVLFADAVDAVMAALEMHTRIGSANDGVPDDHCIQLRAGVSWGEVQVSDIDVFGEEVNRAVLLTRLAPPGRTAVPAVVRDKLVHGLDVSVQDQGECYLRDIAEPQRTFFVSGPTTTAGPLPHARPEPLRPTLAVVPFEAFDLGGVQAYLGEALADEIIGTLSRNPALRMISRLSTRAFRGRARALEGIRTHLHADYVLSGRVHLDADRMRVVLQLVEVNSAVVVWSGSFVGSGCAVFAGSDPLVSNVAAQVSHALAIRSIERARAAPLATLESYCLLMAAVNLLHGVSPQDFERARQMLEHLIERDRRHPAPYAWLAKWHVLRVQQGWGERERDSRLALDLTSRALDLDPASSLTLAIDGFVHCNLLKDLEGAQQRYELALAENPNEPLAWLFQGTLLAFKGEGAAAMSSTQRALELSPLDPMRYFFESLSATAALSAGQWELAIERALRSHSLNCSHTSTLRVLTIAHVQLGKMEEARRWASRLLKHEDLTITAYRARSPSMGFSTGEIWADSLAAAGVPP